MTDGNFLSLWEFFSRCFVPLQRIQLPLKPEHKQICDTLQLVLLGQVSERIVVVNMLPRFGKTKIAEAAVCWVYSYFPDSHFIACAYANTLAARSCGYIESVLESSWFVSLFGARMGAVRQADTFATSAGGVYRADGIGGALTGFGAGLKRIGGGAVIIDDASKPGEALSKKVRDDTNFWFENTLMSRRNSPETPVIILGQRLGPDDLCGYVLRNYGDQVKHIKIPALNEKGESIAPETISTEELRRLEVVSPYTFAAQYMQEPISLGGNLIKTEGLQFYGDEAEGLAFDYKVIVVDTAQKTKERNDFTVMQCWGRLNNRAYLIDQVRGKFEAPELEKTALLFWRKHSGEHGRGRVRGFYVEDKVSGTGLIQSLRTKHGVPVQGVQRDKDKVTRLLDVLPYIATGLVYIPRDAPWVDAFIAECSAFSADMSHRHDDQVDCLIDGVLEIIGGKKVSILDVI